MNFLCKFPPDSRLPKRGKIVSEDDKKLLLAHLEIQYKLAREEVCLFHGFSAGTVTLLLLLLAQSNIIKQGSGLEPEWLISVPVGVVWYGSLLAFLQIQMVVRALYSELLEKKINVLLPRDDIYQFGTAFILPKGCN